MPRVGDRANQARGFLPRFVRARSQVVALRREFALDRTPQEPWITGATEPMHIENTVTVISRKITSVTSRFAHDTLEVSGGEGQR
jgi:hypothetical protein